MAKKYEFEYCVKNPDNFIRQYTDYACRLNDSPWDFHEAIALMLLSCATQGLKLYLPKMPDGLRTNMYVMLFGESFITRKSSAMARGEFILHKAMPWAQLPTNFTPGGLEEAIADRQDQASIIISDEFTFHLGKMMRLQYMEGIRQFLLTMYGKDHWSYRRTSKGGKEKKEDSVVINQSHLSILGNVTPDVCEDLTERDMRDGFLGRFLVIAPTERPPRLKLGEGNVEDIKMQNKLVVFLQNMLKFCDNMKAAHKTAVEKRKIFYPVSITEKALDVIDAFQAEIETKQYKNRNVGTMVRRMTDYALKASMLIAAGELDSHIAARISVDADHAQQALALCNKWIRWSEDFGNKLGYNPMESKIQNVLHLVRNKGFISRSDVSRTFHLTKREMDDIQATLLDRGEIEMAKMKKANSIKPATVWRVPSYDIEAKIKEKKK